MFSKNYLVSGKIALILTGLLGCVCLFMGPCMLGAMDAAEVEKGAAIMQWTLKYRFSSDLKVGDRVIYQGASERGGEPRKITLEVTGKESGNFWIQEKSPDGEMNYLVDLKMMKLIKANRIEPTGEKIDIAALSAKRYKEVQASIKKGIESQAGSNQILSWKKADNRQKTQVPAGSFECICMKPVFTEKYTQQIDDYRKALEDQGIDQAQIEAQTKRNRHEIYFTKQVPKLIPLMATMQVLPWLECFADVEGGLVERKHLLALTWKIHYYSFSTFQAECSLRELRD